MVGSTMNCDAVDLSALWLLDSHYLALMADALGHPEDAARFRADEAGMKKRLNDRLWNPALGQFGSRFWSDAKAGIEVPTGAWSEEFKAEFFSDEAMQEPLAQASAKFAAGKLQGKPTWGTPPAKPWATRWSGSLNVPATGTYLITASGERMVRVYVDGKELTPTNSSDKASRQVSATANLTAGQTAQITVQTSQKAPTAVLKLSAQHLLASGDQFLTRITPMNFYPLIAGGAEAEHAQSALALLTDPKKFWGNYLIPTLPYDDPNWKQQYYWRGTIWGPVNYILWEGIRRYATPAQIAEYAERNVQLFMSNWDRSHVCGENYLSSQGTQSSDPHYTWGALLNLIALESIVDVADDGRIVLNGTLPKTLHLKNIPLLGKRYDVEVTPGKAVLLCEGKPVLEAKGQILRASLR
jgi:glycogen debranching enzyme